MSASLPLTTQVLLTLSYVDQFEYALTDTEIWQRLINLNLAGNLSSPVSLKTVKQALDFLQQRRLIAHQQSFFYLAKTTSAVPTRLKHQQYSLSKWQEVATCVALLKKIPWIKAVAITGSLAMDNVVVDDDIDFLIITQPHAIWLCRLIVLIITSWQHKRRSWQSGGHNTWCFNMWLEENRLAVNPDQHNIYTAYELVQAKFVFDRDQVQEHFYQENAWVKRWLINYHWSARKSGQNQSVHFNLIRILLNSLAFAGQWLYMKPHITTERVGLHVALFHPRNTKSLIFQRWKQSLIELL